MIPAVIQDKNMVVKGLVYLDKEALKLTIETKLLHRYSRDSNTVILKGLKSGNFQKVIGLAFDYDNDAILIKVDSSKPF